MMLILWVQYPCWLVLLYFSCLPFLCIGSHPSFEIWLPNRYWPIGAIYQTSFSVFLQNGLRHIGSIPPFLPNALIWPSLRHRWASSYWPLGAISQTSLNALLRNCLRHIGVVPSYFLNALLRPGLRHRLGNSHWPIGAISQTSLNALLINFLRHIGEIPPFLLTSLLRPSLRHRWAISFIISDSVIFSYFLWRSISSITQHFLNFLPLHPSIIIGLCRTFFTVVLLTCMSYFDFVCTRHHFSSWLAAHDLIQARVSSALLPWRVNSSIFSDPPPLATLVIDAFPLHSVFLHLRWFAVSSPSCDFFLM